MTTIAAAIIADPAATASRGGVVQFEDRPRTPDRRHHETTLAIRAALKTGRHPRNTDACIPPLPSGRAPSRNVLAGDARRLDAVPAPVEAH